MEKVEIRAQMVQLSLSDKLTENHTQHQHPDKTRG